MALHRVLGVVRELRAAGTAVLLVEQLIENALAQGRIVPEAGAAEPDLPHRLERACFGPDVPTALHA